MLEIEKLRSAYFKGKLNAYLDELSADNNISQSDLATITGLLESFSTEKKKNELITAKAYSQKEPPSTDELLNITAEKKEKTEKWITTAREEMKQVGAIIKAIHERLKNNQNIKKDEWLNYGFEILSLLSLIDNFTIVTEQLYRKRLTDLIDEYGISRAEAEERAKLTEVYQDYKKAKLLRENALEAEMLCKKWAGI